MTGFRAGMAMRKFNASLERILRFPRNLPLALSFLLWNGIEAQVSGIGSNTRVLDPIPACPLNQY